MTDNIVSLKTARDERKLIWVCNCGCTNFTAFSDGHLECSTCEAEACGYEENWRERLPDAPDEPEPVGADNFKRVFELDGANGFLRRHAKSDDIAFVAIAHLDGSVSTFNAEPYDTPDRRAWFSRTFLRAARVLNPKRGEL
jgi:hypothetical protein